MDGELLAWCGQNLLDHLDGVALLAADPKAYDTARGGGLVCADRVERLVASTVSRISRLLGVEEALARDHLILALCMHDVGKAHHAYQEILQRYCPRDERRATTAGHELLSAWAAYHTLSAIREVHGTPEGLIQAATIAVALHHSAKRSLDEAYHRLRTILHHPDEAVASTAIEALNRCMARYAKRLRMEGAVAGLAEAALRDSMEKPYPIATLITILENTPRKAALAAEVMVRTLAILDSIDAYIARRGDTPVTIARRYLEPGRGRCG